MNRPVPALRPIFIVDNSLTKALQKRPQSLGARVTPSAATMALIRVRWTVSNPTLHSILRFLGMEGRSQASETIGSVALVRLRGGDL